VVTKILAEIRESGLYNLVKEIRCSVLGDIDPKTHHLFKDPKIRIVFWSRDKSTYERKILKQLHQDSKNEDFDVLYLHSKGVGPKDPRIIDNIADWVDYLIYFNVTHNGSCRKLLTAGADTVGVNLRYALNPPERVWKDREPRLHYSGNFWWAKSEYIRSISGEISDEYLGPEFWIAYPETGRHICLWQSNVDHYWKRYPARIYKGMRLRPTESRLRIK